MKFVIGIDEVGRGPLAGPITLAAFCASQNLENSLIKILGGKIKDSKQLSPKRREEIYKELNKLKKENKISFSISHISNNVIDKKGLTFATKLGIKKSLNRKILKCLASLTEASTRKNSAGFYPCISELSEKEISNLEIRLDGLLKAPQEYKNQKTIIGGDSKDVFIACASIVAKVRRDRLMARLASKFPLYALEIHKGYGTALHYQCLKKHGLSEIHRLSFCKSLLISKN